MSILLRGTLFLGVFSLVPVLVAQAPVERPPLPDLYIESAALDERGFLTVRLVNVGMGALPDAAGALQIVVDGLDQGTIPLGALGYSAPRAPGAAADVRTRLLLTGARRRVAIVVDPENVVEEENEFQNVFTFTADATGVAAPAVVVDDIGVTDDGLLFFTLVNTGAVDLPADVTLRSRVVLNDTWVASDFFVQTQGLWANRANRAVVFPEPPQAVVPPYSDYRVRLRSVDVAVDHSQAELRRRFPFDPIARYAPLLADPRIEQALTWQDTAGVRSYGRWPAAMKAELASALAALETRGVAGPDQPIGCAAHVLGPNEARRVYLAHVAHALWLDARNWVSWHLPSFEVEALRRLLDSRWLFSFNESPARYTFDGGRLPARLSCDPRPPYELLRAVVPALRQAEAYQWSPDYLIFSETILAVSDWVRAHVVLDSAAALPAPMAGADADTWLADSVFPTERRPITVPNAPSLRGLYVGLLRALNLPVDDSLGPQTMQFFMSESSLASLDVSTVLDPVFAPSGEAVAAANMFTYITDLEPWFVTPDIDCDAGRCNSVVEQRRFNITRGVITTLQTALPDFILRVRCTGTADQLEEMLSGPYARPFLDTRDRASVAAGVEARLLEEGDGDRTAGCMRVERRWRRYQAGR